MLFPDRRSRAGSDRVNDDECILTGRWVHDGVDGRRDAFIDRRVVGVLQSSIDSGVDERLEALEEVSVEHGAAGLLVEELDVLQEEASNKP